mmetsp:Transcript_7092/g.16078  ORF Transcript_7092/g.16078 Transcript_7092/m.16078 type:complete len:211 (+) Transcript_7092:363-995(+)
MPLLSPPVTLSFPRPQRRMRRDLPRTKRRPLISTSTSLVRIGQGRTLDTIAKPFPGLGSRIRRLRQRKRLKPCCWRISLRRTGGIDNLSAKWTRRARKCLCAQGVACQWGSLHMRADRGDAAGCTLSAWHKFSLRMPSDMKTGELLGKQRRSSRVAKNTRSVGAWTVSHKTPCWQSVWAAAQLVPGCAAWCLMRLPEPSRWHLPWSQLLQ